MKPTINNAQPTGTRDESVARARFSLRLFVQKYVLRGARPIVWVALSAMVAVPFLVTGGTTQPNIPLVALATEPLYAAIKTDKPTIALALSVEFPTVGAQYVGTPRAYTDNSYANTKEYLGYYDAEACYTYNNAPSETPVAPLTASDYKRFDRTSNATNRMCTGETFSGNFLNWASSSAVDMLRMALSGGDRYIDTPTLTILQRAVLPDASVSTNFWNGSNFPGKILLKSGASNTYWGAIPAKMITAAAGSDISIANDANKIYFRAGSPSGSDKGYASDYKLGTVSPNILNTDGFFYARVQVCNSSAGVLADSRDYGLCKPYPNSPAAYATFKPTGAIQKYSDQLRLAAFGYMPQGKNSSSGGATFGGVLRAPMKYVGYKTFDISGIDNTPAGGNAKAEWDINTGVFKVNPEGDTEFNTSGVINYLNKFGRLGSTQGLYKYYDPLGELYYETLRYLQGLQPTPAAIAGITTAMKDGFPVYTDWTNLDPYGGGRTPVSADYSCLRSNIVTIGDVNIDSSGLGRYPAASAANNVPNLSGWTSTVNNFEKNIASNYTDGQGVTTRVTGNPNGANNSMPGEYMIGAAYWAHTHDIRGTGWTGQNDPVTGKQRPGLRVKSYSFDVNEFSEQSVDSTRRNANELFMVAKYGGFQADPANQGKNPYNTWGNPFKREDGTNDNSVWRDPTRLGPDGVAGNIGEASTYYLQSNARGVLAAFDEIFGNAAAEAKSIAGAAVQSRNVTSAGNAIYQAGFDSGDWSGDLTSIPVTATGSGATTTISVSTTAAWSASDKLAARTARATDRNIVVGRPGATANPAAIPFLWANVSGTSLETDLNKLTPVAASDGLAHDRLDWLRGSKAKEANPFRARGEKYLGDIVNSSVAYSGAPGLPSPQLSSANYVGFYDDNKTRAAAVFVGANDGMLHSFNAATGIELFAYIPSWMGPKLAALTDPGYLVNHQAYVDGSPTVAEAQVGSAGTKDDWKTVLVSGTGAGGQGVFALDVTDPTAFSASKVMWEFTHTDDVDLGNVIGRPQILRMRTNASGAATYKWFAVVPSGVNNYGTAVGGQYSDGNPTLFFLALDKTVGAAWTLGTNYYKVKLPFDSTLATTKPTGLVNFSIVRNGVSGDITQMYMGDLHGKIWKLNFSGVAIADWNINKLTAFDKDPDAANVTPFPLYIAKDASSNIQPITMAPTIAIGPTQNSYYVLFGTGKYLEAADKTNTAQQSVYALYDNGTNNADSSPITSAASIISGRGRLRAGTLDTALRTVTVNNFKWGRAGSDADTTQRSGWYFDFATTGERQVSNFEIIGTQVTFASLYPGSSGGPVSCTASGGGGNLYTLDILSGNGAYRVSDVGILGAVIPFELPQATIITERDSAGRRTKTIKTAQVTQGALGAGTPSYQTTKLDAGRLSWRLINNYQELKKATTP